MGADNSAMGLRALSTCCIGVATVAGTCIGDVDAEIVCGDVGTSGSVWKWVVIIAADWTGEVEAEMAYGELGALRVTCVPACCCGMIGIVTGDVQADDVFGLLDTPLSAYCLCDVAEGTCEASLSGSDCVCTLSKNASPAIGDV